MLITFTRSSKSATVSDSSIPLFFVVAVGADEDAKTGGTKNEEADARSKSRLRQDEEVGSVLSLCYTK